MAYIMHYSCGSGGIVGPMEPTALETHTCPVCHTPWMVFDHVLGLPIWIPGCGHFLKEIDFEDQLTCDLCA